MYHKTDFQQKKNNDHSCRKKLFNNNNKNWWSNVASWNFFLIVVVVVVVNDQCIDVFNKINHLNRWIFYIRVNIFFPIISICNRYIRIRKKRCHHHHEQFDAFFCWCFVLKAKKLVCYDIKYWISLRC